MQVTPTSSKSLVCALTVTKDADLEGRCQLSRAVDISALALEAAPVAAHEPISSCMEVALQGLMIHPSHGYARSLYQTKTGSFMNDVHSHLHRVTGMHQGDSHCTAAAVSMATPHHHHCHHYLPAMTPLYAC